MLDELFTFPIIMIDGDNEEKKIKDKEKFGSLPNQEDAEEEYDMVFGEAEYPYWDFIGLEDRWLPSSGSFQKALDGKFDGCIVRFLHAGQLLVPWTKRKFKAELLKFQQEYEVAHPKQPEKPKQTIVMALAPEQYNKMIGDGNDKTEG